MIMLIPIDIVRELGITASLGVGWMIVTNKMLLPILLSHLRMSKTAATKEAYQESRIERVWRVASGCVEKGRAKIIVVSALVVLAIGIVGAHQLKIGDYGIGVPELRPEARFIEEHADEIGVRGEMRQHALDRDAFLEPLDARCLPEENLGHPAGFKFFDQVISLIAHRRSFALP